MGSQPDDYRLREIERRLINVEGHGVPRDLFDERTRNLQNGITDVKGTIEKHVEDSSEDARALRNLVRSTLLTALSSIVVSVILFIVLKGGG